MTIKEKHLDIDLGLHRGAHNFTAILGRLMASRPVTESIDFAVDNISAHRGLMVKEDALNH